MPSLRKLGRDRFRVVALGEDCVVEERRPFAFAPAGHVVANIQRFGSVRSVGESYQALARARAHGAQRGFARGVGADAVDMG